MPAAVVAFSKKTETRNIRLIVATAKAIMKTKKSVPDVCWRIPPEMVTNETITTDIERKNRY
jgi:hypothetical protein